MKTVLALAMGWVVMSTHIESVSQSPPVVSVTCPTSGGTGQVLQFMVSFPSPVARAVIDWGDGTSNVLVSTPTGLTLLNK